MASSSIHPSSDYSCALLGLADSVRIVDAASRQIGLGSTEKIYDNTKEEEIEIPVVTSE